MTGGSSCYVERAAKRLHDIRLATPVRAVRRRPDQRGHVQVGDAGGGTHRFDAVVIATHPDQALRLLDPPTRAERDVLGAFSYTPNPAQANLPAIAQILSAEQVRVWRLYLAGGALAFEQGRMGVDQILAVRLAR